MKKLSNFYIKNFKIDYGFPIGLHKIGEKDAPKLELLLIKGEILA